MTEPPVCVLPVVVETARLRLPMLTPDEAADLVAGRHRPGWHRDFPRQDDRDAASMYQVGDTWGSRTVVRGATVLGTIGFYGPPDVAAAVPEVEVGYGLVEEARGWGFASEALRGLLAHTDEVGVRVRAAVLPDNAASLRMLAALGFTELRGSDEEGQLVMARPLPASAPAT